MRQPEHAPGGDSVLAGECAAFLAGTLAEHWDERGIVVPVWAWTNLLAHGSLGQIGECIAAPMESRRSAPSWSVARSLVALEIFALTDEGMSLSELQAEVLIPLELELASRTDVSRWSAPRWSDAVDSAIRSQQFSLGF